MRRRDKTAIWPTIGERGEIRVNARRDREVRDRRDGIKRPWEEVRQEVYWCETRNWG